MKICICFSFNKIEQVAGLLAYNAAKQVGDKHIAGGTQVVYLLGKEVIENQAVQVAAVVEKSVKRTCNNSTPIAVALEAVAQELDQIYTSKSEKIQQALNKVGNTHEIAYQCVLQAIAAAGTKLVATELRKVSVVALIENLHDREDSEKS